MCWKCKEGLCKYCGVYEDNHYYCLECKIKNKRYDRTIFDKGNKK